MRRYQIRPQINLPSPSPLPLRMHLPIRLGHLIRIHQPLTIAPRILSATIRIKHPIRNNVTHMHALGPKFLGQRLREGTETELGRGKGSEFGGGFDPCGCARED
jgi:hypothetical protein